MNKQKSIEKNKDKFLEELAEGFDFDLFEDESDNIVDSKKNNDIRLNPNKNRKEIDKTTSQTQIR